MKGIQHFVFSKIGISIILVAFVYQLIMMGILLPGYAAVPNNLDQLQVTVLNEDPKQGKEIAQQLKKALPYEQMSFSNIKQAKKALKEREIQLIIEIPKNFTTQLQDSKKRANIQFYTNEANAPLVKEAMQQTTHQVENTLKQQVRSEQLQAMKQSKEEITQFENKLAVKVTPIYTMREGMQNQLGPLFLVLANIVSSMVVSMLLAKGFKALQFKIGRLQSFMGMQIVIVLAAIIAPLAGMFIFTILEQYDITTLFEVWFTHILVFTASLEIFTISSFVIGRFALFANLAFMFTQIIAGGGIIPREAMYGYYRLMSNISPMYYGIQADYTLLVGGTELASYWYGLLAIIIVVGIISTFIFCTPRSKKTQEAK